MKIYGRKKHWNWVVGLTGGLGSGKTTVLKMLKAKGAYTLDSDEIVRHAFLKRPVVRKIRKVFNGIDLGSVKNRIDKKKLAACVFSEPRARLKLERLLHPMVRHAMEVQLRRRKGLIAVCDVPLLFEKGWQNKFDKILVVEASLPIRLKRLRKRGLSILEARARLKAQWPTSKKVNRADFVVHNSGSIQNTKNQVNKIWQLLSTQRQP